MSGDEAGPEELPDDSPWRPDADVQFDHPPPRPFEVPDVERPQRSAVHLDPTPEHEPDADANPELPTAGGGRRRWAIAAVALAVGAASVVVAVSGGPGPRDGSVDVAAGEDAGEQTSRLFESDPGGYTGDRVLAPGDVPLSPGGRTCLTQRLPSTIGQFWETEIADARRVITPVSVGADTIVAIAEFDVPDSSTGMAASLVALDLRSGAERWRAALEPSTGSHHVLGIVDGTVVVSSVAGTDVAFRRLFAFDELDGRLLWDRGFRGEWSAVVDEGVGAVLVDVEVDYATVGETVALDVRSANMLARQPGHLLGVDSDRRLVTRAGDKVLAAALGGEADARALVGLVESSSSPFALVGSDLVVAPDHGAALAVYGGDRQTDGEVEPRTVPLVGSNGLPVPGFVAGVESLGESALLVSGNRAVHGVNLSGGTAEIRWRVVGAAVASAPTDRGRALLIAERGGARQWIVDSSTGRTITALAIRPGALQTLGLWPNGVVVQARAGDEPVRAAIDLDGRELWTLPGSGPLSVGRGVVVDVGNGAGDAENSGRVAAYGGMIGTQGCLGPSAMHPTGSRYGHPGAR